MAERKIDQLVFKWRKQGDIDTIEAISIIAAVANMSEKSSTKKYGTVSKDTCEKLMRKVRKPVKKLVDKDKGE